ncbi:MAG: hypothetical protein LUK37_09310 [Clostridia bacterium]|nr:hypothetical protein [Clostridia bacterium]
MSLGGLVFAGSVVIMYNMFTVTNHLKVPALATLTTGALNTLIVFTLLNTTELGIYAVVSVSSILALVRNLTVNISYSAKCVGVAPLKFYQIAGRSFGFVIISSVIGSIIAHIGNPASWGLLILCAGVMCVLSISLEYMLFFSKEEKQNLMVMIWTLLDKVSKAKKER